MTAVRRRLSILRRRRRLQPFQSAERWNFPPLTARGKVYVNVNVRAGDRGHRCQEQKAWTARYKLDGCRGAFGPCLCRAGEIAHLFLRQRHGEKCLDAATGKEVASIPISRGPMR
jgi:hypothetical protein